MPATTHDQATECRTPRTSNIHDIHLDAVFRQLSIDGLLDKLDRPDPIFDRTQSEPRPSPPSSFSLMFPPPSPHRGRNEKRSSLAHRQDAPSSPPRPPRPPAGPHPRSLSLPDFPGHPLPTYNDLPTPPQQRKSVRLIDLIDEDFVVNSGALGGGSGGSRRRRGSPRHRRRTSILDMMDRIDQLDSDGHNTTTTTTNNITKNHYGTNGCDDCCSTSVNETISTKSSFSSSSASSSSSSSSFMTSRSYPRGVYIVPVPLPPSSQRSPSSSSSMSGYPPDEGGYTAPLSGPVALVSSEALRHWCE